MNHCCNCFSQITFDNAVFPVCGYDISSYHTERALQPETILNGKYMVGRVLGEGSFGITYLCFDLNLHYAVADDGITIVKKER